MEYRFTDDTRSAEPIKYHVHRLKRYTNKACKPQESYQEGASLSALLCLNASASLWRTWLRANYDIGRYVTIFIKAKHLKIMS
jgi:hypothetical protein